MKTHVTLIILINTAGRALSSYTTTTKVAVIGQWPLCKYQLDYGIHQHALHYLKTACLLLAARNVAASELHNISVNKEWQGGLPTP